MLKLRFLQMEENIEKQREIHVHVVHPKQAKYNTFTLSLPAQFFSCPPPVQGPLFCSLSVLKYQGSNLTCHVILFSHSQTA